MNTEFVGIPDQLMVKVKEAAQREEISVEELVRDALEQRLSDTGFRRLFAVGDRNVKRTGARPEDVEGEIAAERSKRARSAARHSRYQCPRFRFKFFGKSAAHACGCGNGDHPALCFSPAILAELSDVLQLRSLAGLRRKRTRRRTGFRESPITLSQLSQWMLSKTIPRTTAFWNVPPRPTPTTSSAATSTCCESRTFRVSPYFRCPGFFASSKHADDDDRSSQTTITPHG